MKPIAKLAAFATTTMLMSGVASAQTTLKLSHYLPPVHGIHTDFIVPWTEQVTQCTGGAVKFEIFPGGTQLGNVAKQQEQVLAGVVDIAHGLHGIPRGRFPRTSLIELPFMTDDAGAASRTLWAMYPDYLAPEYKGLKVLALHAHNGGLVHTSNKKVEKMEDLKGLRLRTPSPAVSEMLTTLGATPQGLPPGEVYENIQKSVIDGTVFPWDPVKSYGLNEVLKYHLEAGTYTVPFLFVMNQRKYDSLPENVRKCIDQASGDALVGKFGDWWDKWDEAGRMEAQQAGHTITKLSAEERERWRKALQPTIDTYIKQTSSQVENAQQIVDEMRKRLDERK